MLPPCPHKRTLTDPRHGFHLTVAFSAVQKLYGVLQLGGGELFGSALPEVGILPGNGFAGLGALHYHTPLIFRES